MKFTYETQGAMTYLVCELEPAEQMDTLTFGMLTNNHIAGLAPVLYTEMNGQRFLKFNISAKVSLDQFFSGSMNKQRTLSVFQNILNAICSADEYMIEQNCFSVVPEHIFLNVSSCETALICIPVASEKDINPEVANLFKKIMFSTQFDPNEDAAYITQLITYINSGSNFNVYGLRDLVNKLQSGAAIPQAAAPAMQQPAASAPSFDSTISIDDMPTMMAQQPQIQLQPQQRPPVQYDNISTPAPAPAPVRPNPPQPPVPQQKPPMPPTGRPPVNNPVPQGSVRPQQPQAAIPKAPIQNGPGFAIPGQPMGAAAKASIPQKPVQNQPAKTEGDKKMSFFGLLAHYNKENVELYKKQKEDAKKAKALASAKPAHIPGQPPVGNIPGAVPGQQYSAGRPPVNAAPVQQQYTQPQYQPMVQPVPVQNSFNETTVLSPLSVGATTVLSAASGVAQPHLVRVKTGERISINKPVFRIGKEKSYVDYFIADNTAISRSHANVHTENGEYFIEDTNSTNHTYVNGKIINSNVKTKLINGDKIRLANEDFTFSL